jgi:RNA polymerase sigma factor (TIGR02999 family)
MGFPEGTVQGEVTELLRRWSSGDRSALEELTPIVYNELRRLGRSTLRRDGGESLLQPTALVHEVWLRLAGKEEQRPIESRGQFYLLAAKMMRDILVDRLRQRKAAKRGGSQIEVPLEDANPSDPPRSVDFLILDDAMTRLGEINPRYTQIAELRYLAGLTIDEAADVLKVSHATIEREWSFARAWLRRELRSEDRQPEHGRAP